jgi:hypothetical protein
MKRFSNPSVTPHEVQIPGLTAGAGSERRAALQPAYSPARQGGVGLTDGSRSGSVGKRLLGVG